MHINICNWRRVLLILHEYQCFVALKMFSDHIRTFIVEYSIQLVLSPDTEFVVNS